MNLTPEKHPNSPRKNSMEKPDTEKVRKMSVGLPENTILSEHKENSNEELKFDQNFFLKEEADKGIYSLGYVETKMKSNPQWVKLYAKIYQGCLLLYKSFRVFFIIQSKFKYKE